jgi:hypothetical protein
MNNMEKRCGKCERVLPLTEFYKGNSEAERIRLATQLAKSRSERKEIEG